MDSDRGRLYYGTGLDNSQLRVGAAEAKNLLHGIGASATQEGEKIDDAMKNIGKAAAGVFAVSKLKDFVTQVATVRGEFQQLEMAFKTMLGSADKADALMSQLVRTAATTPFGMTDVAQGAKQLLAYGVEADKVNETLIRLGDIAAGLSIPLNDLAYLYGTTMVQGRMYTQDLNQFLGRGIPLTEELAQQFGVSKNKVRELVEEGKVGFPDVEKAIISLTSEGSKFGGLMEAQSQTITGQISNIEDSIESMFNKIGQQSEGVISDTLGLVSSLIDIWESIGKAILVAISAFGAYKAAVILVNTVQTIHNRLMQEAALQKSLAAAQSITLGNAEAMAAARTMLLSRSLNVLKAAFMSNPIGLIAGLLASVAASMMLFSDNTGEAAEMTTKYGDRAATAITRVKTLSTTLNGLTSGTATHKKVMDELNSILEDYGLQAVKEGDSIDTVNEKRAQAIELIKQEAIERQRLNAVEQGMNDYAKALSDAQKQLQNDLSGAETGRLFGGLVWSLDNSELQDNAAAISTIISQVVESNITEIAGKTGDEYEKGLQKIYSTIQDRMRAIGISEKTISKEWFDDGFFIKTDLVGKYISAVQSAKEANDSYTTAVNKAAEAEQIAADSSLTFGEKVAAVEKRLQGPTDGVHKLYQNIKNLMSQYSDNTIGFTIKFSGEVPKWMEKMPLSELQRLAKYFSALGNQSKNGATVNGKYMTQQQLLQHGADYAQAAENKQTEADNKKREEEANAKENKRKAEAAQKRAAQEAKQREQERKRIADETAARNREIADYGASVIEQTEQTELDIRQRKIELMEEGYEKQKAQLDLNYDRLVAENKKREQDMLDALADNKVNEWENAHPKATKAQSSEYRTSLKLTVKDLSPEQQAQLLAYQELAEKSRIQGNKEALNTMLQDVLTYEQQRQKIAEEYEEKRKALYEQDGKGNVVIGEDGKPKLRKGVTQGNIDELNRNEEEALKGIDEQFAQREESYKAWCNAISNLTLEQLEALLKQAQEELKKVEESGTQDPQKLATARAKVNTAKNNVAAAKAKANLNPDKRSLKEWEDLYSTLNECEKEFESIGDTVGGVVGDIIKTASQLNTATLSMINGIMQLSQGASTAIQTTSTAAAIAIQTVEKASVILTIIAAALQIAMKIASLFNDDKAKQEEIEHLQDRIDQLQWELDNADIVRIQERNGKVIELVNQKLAETREELSKGTKSVGAFSAMFERLYLKVSRNDELLTQSAEKIATAYANVAYTADKALGNAKYDSAKEQLENIAKQQLLIQEQIDTERSKKDSDDGQIKEWEQKIEELGAQAIQLINEMVEDIMGGTSSDIAKELSDAFFEAFGNGEDAAEAWHDKVNDIIADIMKRMLTQKFLEEPLGKIFNKYKDVWFKGGKFVGIDAVLSSLSGLTTDLNGAFDSFTAVYDIIKQLPEDLQEKIVGDASREASSAGIAQASQDSVNELNGRATAIQGHTYSISENTKLLVATTQLILQSVLNIESNTNGLSERMVTVEYNVKQMKDTVNDIALKGIKLKT